MDTNMIAISEPTHAAIRFYSDERRKVEIISTKDIENFNGKICFNEPYYVKRYDNQKNNFHLSPAEVLSVGSEEHLLNKKGRYKFSKKRHSDALQQLRLKMEEKQKTSKKNIKMLQKKRQNLERTKISLPGRSRHSEDESDTENNESGNMLAKQSRIFENQEDDTNHNDNQRITETPRHRPRFRRNKVYRLKLQDAPYDSDEEAANEYDNSMRPDTRDVNPEEKQLYDIEGDEIYIGCGKMINLAFWEYMKHRGHWVFLRELLEILWTREALVNRCFKTSRITTELENRPI
ncbi:uncharacterized protein [Temnothorax nylanderi]|uniref:uncharacterized protein isoform X2 n=1 Tax=Temnothorax nylanderi TaxID=102681 RepID=UPI003A85A5C6